MLSWIPISRTTSWYGNHLWRSLLVLFALLPFEVFDQMRNHLTEQFHIDLENIRQDTGQNDVFLEMVNWDYEVAEPILKEFNIDEEELS